MLEFADSKKNIQEFGSRQLLGETTVFSPAPLTGEVKAKEKTFLLRISADQLYRVMALHPTLAYSFLEELSRRVRLSEKKIKKGLFFIKKDFIVLSLIKKGGVNDKKIKKTDTTI